ncbi:DeoR/GlpR family DNA-binding transcription regulator [Paenibacillus sediminis]|uniref:DeoR/GlpR family transcriptional regulator of sugar metabolism n=1 Tax=Paenibacillus sediminis TaxID=664909 RepID=A0ABS4H134_9BACL|nr:DeoR/GlpR family DNA-binding transcription regulator [Paenibacillus sediminis]MBP1936191.1 DeoR/GlpR family transcriptional regulator of sugar metabolism [Paenibacillus sediminis]
MYQEERIQAILEYLKEHQRVSIQDICRLFEVSRDTARRDLLKMDELGVIIRTHGGAVLPTQTKEVKEYKDRLTKESGEKQEIGRFAATLVKNGDFIAMDASTTVQYAAENISAQDIVVVTNSIDNADTLSKKEKVTIHLLGGILDPKHRFLYGSATLSKLADYHVDKLFLGACGITSSGLSFPHEEDGAVKREMIRRAGQVIVLADHTKFEHQMFYKIADLEEVDLLITDKRPSDKMMNELSDHGVQLFIVSEENNDD